MSAKATKAARPRRRVSGNGTRRSSCRACKRRSAAPTSLQVPRLEKIVLNMGLGEAIQNAKLLDAAVEEMATIAGQKPVITKSRKAIANFKLRENMPIGCMVTLRGDRMYEFFDRLVNVALPRVRGFQGPLRPLVRRARQLLARYP